MQTLLYTVSAHSSLNPSLFNNLQVQVPSPSQIMSLEHQYGPNNENLVLTHNVMNWTIGSTHATHLRTLNRFSSHSEVCGDSLHCVCRWRKQQSWGRGVAQVAVPWLSTASYTKGSPVSSTNITWLTWVQRGHLNAKICPKCIITANLSLP